MLTDDESGLLFQTISHEPLAVVQNAFVADCLTRFHWESWVKMEASLIEITFTFVEANMLRDLR